jgi:hypothetical protein
LAEEFRIKISKKYFNLKLRQNKKGRMFVCHARQNDVFFSAAGCKKTIILAKKYSALLISLGLLFKFGINIHRSLESLLYLFQALGNKSSCLSYESYYIDLAVQMGAEGICPITFGNYIPNRMGRWLASARNIGCSDEFEPSWLQP